MKIKKQAPRRGIREVVVKGKPMIMLAEADSNGFCESGRIRAALPELKPDGNYPAMEYLRVSLARKIIRHRADWD